MTPGIREANEGTPHRGIVPVADYEEGWGGASLEKALDQATERYSLSIQRRVAAQRAEVNSSETRALTLAAAHMSSLVPVARLRWRGLDVSDEFQRYAVRVARGEALAPYRGQVLARPCVEFPWSTEGPVEATAPLPRRSAFKAGWLAGVGSLLAVLALGGTVTAISGDDAESLPPNWTPAAALAESAVEALPGPSIPIGTPDSLSPPAASKPEQVTTPARGELRMGPQRTSARAQRQRSNPAATAPLAAHATAQTPERTPAATRRDVTRVSASKDSAATSLLLLEAPPF